MKEAWRILYNLCIIAFFLYGAYICSVELNDTLKSVLNGWAACFIYKWAEWPRPSCEGR